MYDPDSVRVYIAHGDRVTVVNGGSVVTGAVAGMPGGTHGIAIYHATLQVLLKAAEHVLTEAETGLKKEDSAAPAKDTRPCGRI